MRQKPIAIVDNPHLGKLLVFNSTKEVKDFIKNIGSDWVASSLVASIANYKNWDTQLGLSLRNGYRFIALPLDTKKILNDIIND